MLIYNMNRLKKGGKNKMKKYKWNYKKFLLNVSKLVGITILGFMFVYAILGIAGVDILL